MRQLPIFGILYYTQEDDEGNDTYVARRGWQSLSAQTIPVVV